MTPVIRAAGNGVELAQMRWSFPPPRPGGKPVFNFRSKGRSFRDSRRCLIPATAFFEFTGQRTPKTKHRFTLAGQPFFCIIGIWREGPLASRRSILPTGRMRHPAWRDGTAGWKVICDEARKLADLPPAIAVEICVHGRSIIGFVRPAPAGRKLL
jgi:hypothetical protein